MTSVREVFDTMEYGPAPESAKPAEQWLEQRNARFGHFIGGTWTKPSNTFEVINPATGKRIAAVSEGSATEVDAAVKAARKALPAWQALGGHGRARYLYALARAVQRNSRLLAVLESMDNGKSIRETRDIDVPLVARHFYHHAGWAQLMDTEFAGHHGAGVVGQIIPWNFPLLMMAWKVAPALAAGCTIVIKPAEFTPLTALVFGELAESVGLPAGVLNIVTGDGDTGAAIVAHDGVDKIAFTGSTEVGRIIRKATAGSGKKLSLELGGKSPFIVFDDADLDSVVEGVVDAIWFNQGQVCCAGSRLLAQEGIAERLYTKLRARMETLRLGSPLDKAVDMGAIVAPVQLERIRSLVDQGKTEGADFWQPSWACPTEGCFYPPTLFTNVQPSSSIAQVEIFGPVLVAMTFRTPSEAVALANNTPYGLAASVWSESINLALDIAPKIKAGVVWINSTNLFDAAAGFGGYRESGFGREGGREGMYEYLKKVGRAEERRSGRSSSRKAARASERPAARSRRAAELDDPDRGPLVDRTAKLFIGGKQARPDSGYSRRVVGANGRVLGEVGDGNRKDLRNAVEAAHGALAGWSKATGHNRAQILYYIAENLAARSTEFAARVGALTGGDGEAEVDACVRRLFTYGAWADKYDGQVHQVPLRGVALAMNEPIGVIGVAAPEEHPLLGLVSLVGPAIAVGNTVVAIPSERAPLAATDFYQVLETSDLPAGVINIVTGAKDALAKTLAEHDDVDAVWYFGSHEGVRAVELASAGNMKRTFAEWTTRDWLSPADGEGREFLREATQVKNIWIPYGE
ncbi:MAG: aldehyde dehydrogenase family protein [Gemmatimonadaceae bacterium]|nr:aldehyde dehydrogenase family protein [Gemmatimonadaceae bacterium]NUS32294.1 aldehyde dehydrogenase family protein [Gemmatimonadaceae bacterium]NUS47174.1 aldehyde dehydrogenase family protein [Gemmatimonadaceae bacterium]